MIKTIQDCLTYLYDDIRGRTDIAVVGCSGGADSTLVATLCAQALGPENVYALHMPYGTKDYEVYNARSLSLARKLGIKSAELPITEIADSIGYMLGAFKKGGKASQLQLGNARSRARMCLLYGVAGTLAETNSGKRVRVVGTGNLSEDYIGYDTKGGDALADFFPIGELFKSEVYQLLDHFVDQGLLLEEHVDRVPSAGLWDGQTDEGELGHTYAEMEPAIKYLLRDDPGEIMPRAQDGQGVDLIFWEVLNFVEARHNANKHKHEAPTVVPLRDQFCD